MASPVPLDSPEAVRLNIYDFKPGSLYSVREVMTLFGRSDQWVRSRIAMKLLDGKKIGGIGAWVVSGESIRILYSSLGLLEDLSGPPVREVPVDVQIKRIFADLDRMNGKKPARKTRTKQKN